MNPTVYYTMTFIAYLSTILGGLMIKDLGIVFELLAGFTLSFLGFIWPGLFYLLANSRYGGRSIESKTDIRKNKMFAVGHIIIGVLVFMIIVCAQFYDNIY